MTIIYTHIFYNLLHSFKIFRLKLKLLNTNLELRSLHNQSRLYRITPRITQDVHHLQWEVHCYNQHFWSQVIFAFISCFILNAAFTLYALLFSEIPLVLRLTTLSALVVGVITFGMLLNAVCRINQLGRLIYHRVFAFHASNYSLVRCADLGLLSYVTLRTKLKVN